MQGLDARGFMSGKQPLCQTLLGMGMQALHALLYQQEFLNEYPNEHHANKLRRLMTRMAAAHDRATRSHCMPCLMPDVSSTAITTHAPMSVSHAAKAMHPSDLTIEWYDRRCSGGRS